MIIFLRIFIFKIYTEIPKDILISYLRFLQIIRMNRDMNETNLAMS